MRDRRDQGDVAREGEAPHPSRLRRDTFSREREKDSALLVDIRAIIEADGPIGIDRYMQLCLQHPLHGYYTTREAIGRGGDFITAPEISQMFGELIGLWAAQVWLDAGQGPIRLVELGPGRGTLMADALRATRIVPGFHDALRVDMVETSPRLEARQREALAGVVPLVAWHRTIEDVPPGPAIVIANEFFDALPVRQYVRDERDWHERVIGLDAKGALAFGLAAEALPLDQPLRSSLRAEGEATQERQGAPSAKSRSRLLGCFASLAMTSESGAILEIGHIALAAMTNLAKRIVRDGGALLAIDYGHAVSSLGETLQAVRRHRFADPLAAPGEADLTAHVDFAALARAAAEAGAEPHGPVPQGLFLQRLGIGERAAKLKRGATPEQSATIDAALARLAGPASDMASLFKVLAVVPCSATIPPGFEEPI